MSSSSNIPEDQQQAVIKLVDDGVGQAAAVSQITGKPVKTIPTAWRTILNREEGRREERAKAAQQPAPQHECTRSGLVLCPQCGCTFTPEGT